MATELGFIECMAHGDQEVREHKRSSTRRRVKLACRCVLEFDAPQIGDAVVFEGQLYSVDWVGHGEAFDELLLRNNEEKFHIESYSVQFVAKDKLSSPMNIHSHNRFDINVGGSRYFPKSDPRGYDSTWETKAEPPPPKRKRSGISTAELISKEVQQLKKQEKTPQPIEPRRPQDDLAGEVEPVQQEPREVVGDDDAGIPYRTGDW